MLDKKHIDQLFLEKLKDYEQDPPVFLWNSIESEISKAKESGNFLTIFAVAAAVIVIFLSGWWLTADHSDQLDSQKIVSTEIHKPLGEQENIDSKSDSPEKIKPSAFSMATFAAKSSLAYKKSNDKSAGEEPFPIDIRNTVISRINQDDKILSKIAEWLSLTNPDQNDASLKSRHFETKNTFEVHPEKYKDLNLRWSIGIQAGPVFTGGLKSTEGLKAHAENTIAAGVITDYKISKRLSVRSGLIFNQMKQRSELVNSPYSDQSSSFVTPSGKVNFNPIANSPENQYVLTQKFDYLSIPLITNYKIIDKKISLGVNAGISANILTDNKAGLSGNQMNNKGETADMRDVAFSGELGLELGYEIGKRITITIEPHLKQYINSLSTNSAVSFKPFQAGLITAVSYSFN